MRAIWNALGGPQECLRLPFARGGLLVRLVRIPGLLPPWRATKHASQERGCMPFKHEDKGTCRNTVRPKHISRSCEGEKPYRSFAAAVPMLHTTDTMIYGVNCKTHQEEE